MEALSPTCQNRAYRHEGEDSDILQEMDKPRPEKPPGFQHAFTQQIAENKSHDDANNAVGDAIEMA